MAVVAADQMAVFDDPDWRTDLGLLAESTRVAARHYAADAFLLSSLAERVPSPTGGSQGAVPWQSFLREVAVARGLQEGAALREVQRAELLARALPRAVERLACGQITVQQAMALCDELVTTDAAVAREVDRRLHDRLPTMSPERVRKEARRLVELLDADAAADRAAKAAAGRAVRLKPGVDGQASAWLTGPALPMTRWHAALTETARALREAGDPRGVDALRFDLVMGGFTHDDSLPAVVVPGPQVEEHLPPAPPPFPAGPDAAPQVPVGAERSDDRATSSAQSEPAPPAGPPDPLWQARAQAERVLEAAHAAEAEALHRLQQVRAEHDRLIALVVRERLALSSTLPADRRAGRPVQLLVHVPVTTLVGLAHEPGYLEGYGWIGAPQCRQLLPTAELRQVCTDGNGMVIDLARRAVRAGLSPAAAREALLRMATEAFDITDAACEPVEAHARRSTWPTSSAPATASATGPSAPTSRPGARTSTTRCATPTARRRRGTSLPAPSAATS